jgi:hypothetical protein
MYDISQKKEFLSLTPKAQQKSKIGLHHIEKASSQQEKKINSVQRQFKDWEKIFLIP